MRSMQSEKSRSCSIWLLNLFRPGKHPAKTTAPREPSLQHLQTQVPQLDPRVPGIPEKSFPLFLDLPRELRDKVYEIYLLFPLPARPISHSEAIRRDSSTKSTFYNPVRYSPDPPHLTGQPLLLCNRQINAEVQDTITRWKTRPEFYYILDCELIGERYIYPTWLLLPVFTKRVPLVYVDFRSTGVVYPSYYRGWKGNGGPPNMIWGLLDIVQKFSAHGPHFAATSSTRKDVFIDTLVLDVLSCGNNVHNGDAAINGKDSEPIARPFELEEWARSESPVSGRTMESEEPVLDALVIFLGWLFVDGKETTAIAKNVVKAVRKIYLLHDGVEVRAWDTQSYEHLR